MQYGSMKHQCLIERKSVTQDATYGTEVITWVAVGTTFASVEDVPPSLSEAVKNGLNVARNQTKVQMRWRTDVDSTMRLTINRPAATLYQIIAGPAEVGNKRAIEFMVERFSS